MRDTLIELKAIAGQQVALLHEQRTMLQHAAALLEGQRVILETLRREERETREALNHASGN
ncbi:MAG TPA: hypothetical protein PLD47_18125 [Aggregatilineales bacterium]|nr:hypothetical protein [Aggregatilineales bacterium]